MLFIERQPRGHAALCPSPYLLRLMARLGGFLGRKSDGDPDVKTIWIGLKEAQVVARTLRELRTSNVSQNCV